MMLERALVIVIAGVLPMACVAETEGRDDLGGAYEPGEDDDVDADADDGKGDDPVAIGALAPVCTTGYSSIDCHPSSTSFTIDGTARDVLWKVPAGTPPAGGWPVVLAFHGTNDPAGKFFAWSYWSTIDNLYGGYYETKTVQGLLDAGFAVLAPKARVRAGSIYWDTNIPPYATDWDSSPDGAFVERLFDEIEAGTFGPLNVDRKYAMGLSSGGYMASRLAVSYPGEIQGIALQSASYATCISSLPCDVSDEDLPEEHAATLLMAGYWDAIVPLYTINDYFYALEDNGTPAELHVVGYASHQWTSSSPGWVLGWFQAH
jgi:poly(3-hydroxybutyrate) depolymerase